LRSIGGFVVGSSKERVFALEKGVSAIEARVWLLAPSVLNMKMHIRWPPSRRPWSRTAALSLLRRDRSSSSQIKLARNAIQ